ncbi:8-amino-7-oxononanoate synthase [Citrifermentans bemidjiense Bem]|uniref:8-amino-7-oxononanoate synthase n=1 Tax=Citrifermentans bemidjiense (strain ATCC BAA-1014 / DSM 16622 / JCM 12645 / Bem) TaxID=404380 RepID=BIOF_CITBB|nr:8-amino-7-oxononanoate synthase [Citrifermentans bemidjiense]B5EEV8.1 RecName: Full=8-amino-7-oxononanoate synthase; Short=AONS; AltName: Full=7-keto-8-amino-pelargonic acid synthase; Short=7-KAP synthase; Short=KAPA synthase; AltName: Full=8-amino-7-ketopelargonate synthase [Citrifermentans bemidjiense Bem]ACH37854.1 8-amino-7-oxononanoate synthase [Citrifermentans bemidjiense Bem]
MQTFAEELEALRAEGLYRSMRVIKGAQGSRVELDGKQVLMLCSNNYLGLADHPELRSAAVFGVAFGVGSGASRLVSGTMELHEKLEERIAAFKGTEKALVFNSGYAANTGIVSALVGRGDAIFSDRLNHASIIDGALLSRADLHRYPHRDMAALERLLQDKGGNGRRLIVTDGVFSMDGDIAPLQDLVRLAKKYGALLMVDDAHGTGVLGPTGRGSGELLGVMDGIDIHMGTLGKGLGSFGAYAAASATICDYLVNKARSFIFSTSLPPAVLAASIAAIELVDSPEGKELREKLAANVALFKEKLAQAGFDTMGSETQIVPIFVGPADATMEFSKVLLEQGIFVQGIRPPTVPSGSCRLRCTIMATHEPAELEEAAGIIEQVGKKLGVV